LYIHWTCVSEVIVDDNNITLIVTESRIGVSYNNLQLEKIMYHLFTNNGWHILLNEKFSPLQAIIKNQKINEIFFTKLHMHFKYS